MSRDEFIVEVWEGIGKEVVGADELIAIQNAVVEKFGSSAIPSPALIARVLADQGVRLRHPEILQADSRWREQRLSFTPDDLAFDGLDTALVFIKRLEQADPTDERLRLSVQHVKTELGILATRSMADNLAPESPNLPRVAYTTPQHRRIPPAFWNFRSTLSEYQ
jgi:hypothetical protein